VTPVIHRAIYFVEEGEQMWEGGPEAPHEGYITKGDNMKTNSFYDQQGQISYLSPVKEEWIIGVARYKIPYIGHIRLLLS
jgi:signal peptidase